MLDDRLGSDTGPYTAAQIFEQASESGDDGQMHLVIVNDQIVDMNTPLGNAGHVVAVRA